MKQKEFRMKHVMNKEFDPLFMVGPEDQDGSGTDEDGPLPHEEDLP
jgi:hypothetical protein